MSGRRLPACARLALALAIAAAAPAANAVTARPAPTSSPARGSPAPAAPAAPSTSAAPAAAMERARTLEAITIEGDLQVPPVQFITARDCQRFADDAGRRYRPGALAVLAELRAPVRLRVTAPPGCPPFESIPLR